jgi:hypothetical protein
MSKDISFCNVAFFDLVEAAVVPAVSSISASESNQEFFYFCFELIHRVFFGCNIEILRLKPLSTCFFGLREKTDSHRTPPKYIKIWLKTYVVEAADLPINL